MVLYSPKNWLHFTIPPIPDHSCLQFFNAEKLGLWSVIVLIPIFIFSCWCLLVHSANDVCIFQATLDLFDRNEPRLVILDETVKDMERYIGQKPVSNVAKKAKLNREKFMTIRQSLKVVEVSTDRDLEDAEKFDRLTRTYVERSKIVEETLTIVRETKSRNILQARRDLDLIKVSLVCMTFLSIAFIKLSHQGITTLYDISFHCTHLIISSERISSWCTGYNYPPSNVLQGAG